MALPQSFQASLISRILSLILSVRGIKAKSARIAAMRLNQRLSPTRAATSRRQFPTFPATAQPISPSEERDAPSAAKFLKSQLLLRRSATHMRLLFRKRKQPSPRTAQRKAGSAPSAAMKLRPNPLQKSSTFLSPFHRLSISAEHGLRALLQRTKTERLLLRALTSQQHIRTMYIPAPPLLP